MLQRWRTTAWWIWGRLSLFSGVRACNGGELVAREGEVEQWGGSGEVLGWWWQAEGGAPLQRGNGVRRTEVTTMRLDSFCYKWGRENEEVAGRSPTHRLNQLARGQLPCNGDARAQGQGTVSAAPRGTWRKCWTGRSCRCFRPATYQGEYPR
jgi:hypothetical protein